MLKKTRTLIFSLFIFVFACSLSAVAQQLSTNTSKNEGVYVDEKITTPISKVGVSKFEKKEEKLNDFNLPSFINRKIKAAKINFKSKGVENDIKDYVIENVGLVPNYQLFFSFMLYDDKTMVGLDVSALPLINNEPPYPTTYSYGGLCERANLAKDKIRKDYRDSNMMPVDTVIDARIVDIGPTLIVLYATLRELGGKYYTYMPDHLRGKPFYYVSASIYNNDLHVSVVREKG